MRLTPRPQGRIEEIEMKELIGSWKAALPSDLEFGEFEDEFTIEGRHYKYGAWNSAGDWWLAWNTDKEFKEQLSMLDDDEIIGEERAAHNA